MIGELGKEERTNRWKRLINFFQYPFRYLFDSEENKQTEAAITARNVESKSSYSTTLLYFKDHSTDH